MVELSITAPPFETAGHNQIDGKVKLLPTSRLVLRNGIGTALQQGEALIELFESTVFSASGRITGYQAAEQTIADTVLTNRLAS